MKKHLRFTSCSLSTLLLLPCLVLAEANSDQLNQATQIKVKTDESSVSSQKKIEGLAEKNRDLIEEYRMTLQRIENTKAYNAQMENLIASQKEEMKAIVEQMENLKHMNKEILPLMGKMVESLEKFVELDVPFLLKERRARVTELKDILGRANVSTSEKYRRIMEAYQVENEYGRTIEAYRDTQVQDNKELTVDFLRVGRVALMYQTLDGNDSYLWNPTKHQWEELPGKYTSSIRKGLRRARKQVSPY